MNKLKSNLESKFFGISIVLLLFITISTPANANTKILLIEDFEVESTSELNGWTLSSYHVDDFSQFFTETPSRFTIHQGALNAADNILSIARHESTITTGNWSFDWITGLDTEIIDSFEFMFTDTKYNYSWGGQRYGNFKFTGYGLMMVQYDSSRNGEIKLPSIWEGPSLKLVKFVNESYPNSVTILENYNFNGVVSNETHHIDIIREENGQMKVYFDKQKVIDIQDDTIKTSETFSFSSYEGRSSIDNIQINELEVIQETTSLTTTTTTVVVVPTSELATSSIPFLTVVLGVITPVSIVLLKRRK